MKRTAPALNDVRAVMDQAEGHARIYGFYDPTGETEIVVAAGTDRMVVRAENLEARAVFDPRHPPRLEGARELLAAAARAVVREDRDPPLAAERVFQLLAREEI